MVQAEEIRPETPDHTPIRLRLCFSKTGRLRYISHLDLVRTMTKAVVRARLPVWYTQGFNPVPKMVFATPMSVGMESLCELMDIRMSERIDPALALERLSRAVPSELRFLRAYEPQSKLTDARYAVYEVLLHTDIASEETVGKIRALLADPTLKCTGLTHGKQKERVVGGQTGDATAELGGDGIIRLGMTLGVSQGEFLNPDYVMTALAQQLPILSGSPLTNFVLIRRLEILSADRTPFS